MGLGSFLSRVAHSVQNTVDDLRYQRDWGANYKKRFAAEQDFLDNLAREREEQRARQDRAEQRAIAADKRQEEEAAARRRDANTERLSILGAPQDDGRILLPDPVSLGLAKDADEGASMVEIARRSVQASRTAADEKRREADADKEDAFQRQVRLAKISAGLHAPRPDKTPSADELLKDYRTQARQIVSAHAASLPADSKDVQDFDTYEKRVKELALRLASEDPRVGPELQRRAAAAAAASNPAPAGPAAPVDPLDAALATLPKGSLADRVRRPEPAAPTLPKKVDGRGLYERIAAEAAARTLTPAQEQRRLALRLGVEDPQAAPPPQQLPVGVKALNLGPVAAQQPAAAGADPMVISGGKLVPLSSLPPDKQAKARAYMGL